MAPSSRRKVLLSSMHQTHGIWMKMNSRLLGRVILMVMLNHHVLEHGLHRMGQAMAFHLLRIQTISGHVHCLMVSTSLRWKYAMMLVIVNLKVEPLS